MAKTPLVTIVVPAYNEEMNLPQLEKRLIAVLSSIQEVCFEVLLIDNCSEDNTENIMIEMSARNQGWKHIRFSRNFGFETSLAAGLHYAAGDALIYLSSDLQEPPEEIPKMVSIWLNSGCDIVYGVVGHRNDYSFLKTLGAKIAYWLIHKLSDSKIPANATDFRLISRPVINVLKRCSERSRYMRGLVHWVGFRTVSFTYDRAERIRGHTTANIFYSFRFAIQALVANSQTPLHLTSFIGFFFTMIALAGIILYGSFQVSVLLGYPIFAEAPDGWTSLIIAILFFGGVQCMFLGIIGEYIGRIYTETKHRPRWIVANASGFVGDAKESQDLRSLHHSDAYALPQHLFSGISYEKPSAH